LQRHKFDIWFEQKQSRGKYKVDFGSHIGLKHFVVDALDIDKHSLRAASEFTVGVSVDLGIKG
jgi:hypothetical protein